MSKLNQAAKLAKQTELFDLQNKEDQGKISITHIGDCLRALGYQPSEKEIDDIKSNFTKNQIEQIELNEFSLICFEQDRIQKDKLNYELELKQSLKGLFDEMNAPENKNANVKLEEYEFKTFDWDLLEKFLTTTGEPFTPEEIEDFRRRFVKKQNDKDGLKDVVDATELIENFVQKEQQ